MTLLLNTATTATGIECNMLSPFGNWREESHPKGSEKRMKGRREKEEGKRKGGKRKRKGREREGRKRGGERAARWGKGKGG